MDTRSELRNDIQIIRGIAVIAVILFHSKESIFKFGYLGVDIFFVISGFVITPKILKITTQPNFTQKVFFLKKFFSNRFYRLAPTLGLVVSVSLLLVLFLSPISQHKKFAIHSIFSIFLLGNIGADKFAGNYFDPTPSPFLHIWSLAVESQIYMFLPVMLLLVCGKTSKVTRIAFFLFLISIVSLFLFSVPENNVCDVNCRFYLTPSRIWQFNLGSFAYLIQKKWVPSNFTYKIICYLFYILIFLAPMVISRELVSFFASVCTALSILSKAFQVNLSFVGKFLSYVGNRSYSLYLVHFPLLFFAKHSNLPIFSLFSDRKANTLVAVIFTFILGIYCYNNVENRFRNASDSPSRMRISLNLSLYFPCLLSVLLLVGSPSSYWQLFENVSRPSADWETLKSCEILSDPYSRKTPCYFYVNNASGTALLIGDSHAAHFGEAFKSGAKSNNLNSAIWASAGCPFVVLSETKNYYDKSCVLRNYRILEWIKINKPSTVFVSQYIKSDSSLPDLERSLSKIKSLVSDLWIVPNTPVFPGIDIFDLPPVLKLTNFIPEISYKESQLIDKNVIVSNKLKNWATRNGIHILDLWPIICSDKVCMRRISNEWLYRDSDHLSVFGSKLSTPYFVLSMSRKKEASLS